MSGLRNTAKALFESADGVFARAFTPAWNPLAHLGTLGWFFYWIVIVSGIYLYVFFDTGISQAYESLEYITNVQWYADGIMRSLHRYASDALIIVMMLHLAREFIMDRYRGARWFTWFTGVPLLWLVFACGISGYWMVWDVLAQYIAIASTEWIDSLGIFGQSIARNFLNSDTLSGRFFTLMVFIHIAVPLFMLLVMWIHIQRQRNAKVNPPLGLAAGTLAMLLVLSVVRPAVSQPAANLDKVPSVMDFDWFYLIAYPLLDTLPGQTVWAIAGGATLLLVLLPWLPPMQRQATARVDLDNCNGCGRCVDAENRCCPEVRKADPVIDQDSLIPEQIGCQADKTGDAGRQHSPPVDPFPISSRPDLMRPAPAREKHKNFPQYRLSAAASA